MTLEPLILFAEDRHASHSLAPVPGGAEARQMTAGSGQRCIALCKNSGPLGSWLRMCLRSMDLHSNRWLLTWKVAATKSRRRLKFRLVPSDSITGGRASGFLHTPTATANQGAPSMRRWPSCRGIEVSPEAWERRMGLPPGHTDGLGLSDTSRMRMAGNAVVVDVAEWIGRRIMAADGR